MQKALISSFFTRLNSQEKFFTSLERPCSLRYFSVAAAMRLPTRVTISLWVFSPEMVAVFI